MSLSASLQKLENTLAMYNYTALREFLPGLQLVEISSLLTELGIDNKELISLYNWKNGCEYYKSHIGKNDFFLFGKMLSLKDAIDLHIRCVSNKMWSESYFPIFAEGGGIYILIDINKKSESYGMLFLFAPSLILSEEPMSIYDSLTSFIETTIISYEKGIYKVSMGDNLEIDDDKLYSLSNTMNPQSEYWKLA